MIDAPIQIAQACGWNDGPFQAHGHWKRLGPANTGELEHDAAFSAPLRSRRDCGRGRSRFPRMFDTCARRPSAPMLARASAAVCIRRSP